MPGSSFGPRSEIVGGVEDEGDEQASISGAGELEAPDDRLPGLELKSAAEADSDLREREVTHVSPDFARVREKIADDPGADRILVLDTRQRQDAIPEPIPEPKSKPIPEPIPK